jgi:hypothetical protein
MAARTKIPRADRNWDTVAEVCDRIDYTPSGIYYMLETGDLRGVQLRPNGLWRVNRHSVEELVARLERALAPNGRS